MNDSDSLIHLKKIEKDESGEDVKVLFAYKGKGYSCESYSAINSRGKRFEATEIKHDETALQMEGDVFYPLIRMQLVYAVTFLDDGIDGVVIDKRLIN